MMARNLEAGWQMSSVHRQRTSEADSPLEAPTSIKQRERKEKKIK